jgi:D-3-phosphoglycerate dehydrogenase
MPKVLVLDNLSEEAVEIFEQANFDVTVEGPQTPEDLKAIIGQYDGVVVRSATKIPAEVLEHAGNLKVIGRAGVGTDNIDKEAATKHGVVVMNAPGGNTISTCEHTFALMLALCRQIPAAHASMMDGRWDRKKFKGAEVFEKTLGVIGVGRIGGALAKRAQAFGMKVLAFDPILNEVKAKSLGVTLVALEELLTESDFVSIHVPKTDKTTNMIDAQALKKMKPTARIINAARGGIVNEKDLAEALGNGTIAGAALDVYTSEPFADNPFIGLDNIVTTPHLAASTEEAQTNVALDVSRQMVDYLTTGAIVNAVNVPSLDRETSKKLRPLLTLGRQLGRFQSLFTPGKPNRVEIEYAGDVGVTDTYPITASILQGFLEHSVESVNMVSAPHLLDEHGIEFSEIRSPKPSDYSFSLSVKVESNEETHTVRGTLFGPNKDPRICNIDHTRVDVRPEGWILVTFNEDKPLIIGRIAMAIGESGVNIADMTLGRDAKGGRAATVLNLDEPLSDEQIEKIRDVPYVNNVYLVPLGEMKD